MRKKNKISFSSESTSNYPIIIDGETEKWYFEMLKKNEPSLNIKIKPELSNKKSIEEQYNLAIKLVNEEYSKVFWIIDLDVIIKETKECKKNKEKPIDTLSNYIDSIISNENYKDKVVIIINNPCLELWILLHYNFTTKSYNNCKELTSDLKKYLSGYSKKEIYYKKKGNDIYFRLKDKLENAIANSKSLGQFDKENYIKSISEMWKFFDTEPIKTYFQSKITINN